MDRRKRSLAGYSPWGLKSVQASGHKGEGNWLSALEDRGALCHANLCEQMGGGGEGHGHQRDPITVPCHLRWGGFGVSNHVDQSKGLGVETWLFLLTEHLWTWVSSPTKQLALGEVMPVSGLEKKAPRGIWW